MINAIYFLIPEIFLSLSIFTFIIFGVFKKNSFDLIYRATIVIIPIVIFLILNNNFENIKIFNNSFALDEFSSFMKILILVSSFFVLIMSKKYIQDINNNKFEYPVIMLIAILGMFFMVSSNDLILFYLGLELQSLALYILAAIDRDNIRATESGVKYFVLSALSSGLLLYGCSLLYGFTGSTNFEIINTQLDTENIGSIFAKKLYRFRV